MNTFSTLRCVLCLSALSLPVAAHADTLLFNLSPTNGTTVRSTGSAPAQGVIAGTTTTISSFSMYVATPAAENLKFFIDNGSGTSVLFSAVKAVGANSAQTWLSSGALSFTLVAGNEYFFGVVGDGPETDIGYIFPTTTYSSNGLTADTSGNINIASYANPTILAGQGGSAQLGLQLYGGGNAVTTTPEPSSLMLLGTGALGVLGAARRRFTSKR